MNCSVASAWVHNPFNSHIMLKVRLNKTLYAERYVIIKYPLQKILINCTVTKGNKKNRCDNNSAKQRAKQESIQFLFIDLAITIEVWILYIDCILNRSLYIDI